MVKLFTFFGDYESLNFHSEGEYPHIALFNWGKFHERNGYTVSYLEDRVFAVKAGETRGIIADNLINV